MKTMKNKWIFIGIGILLIMVVGVIVFLHFTAPEVLTKTPLELITGRVIQNGAKDVISAPTKPVGVTDSFIVSDDLWQYAFPLNKAGGGPFHRAVGFSEVPVGTKLHAPMDGRVHFFWMGEGTPEENHMVILAKPGWDTEENRNVRSMQFSAKGIEVLNWEPKEGEPFAIIKDVGELFPGFYDRAASLMIGVDPWAETLSDRSIADSRVYIRKAIEKQN